jgi:hypothetical protein
MPDIGEGRIGEGSVEGGGADVHRFAFPVRTFEAIESYYW